MPSRIELREVVLTERLTPETSSACVCD